MMDTVTGVDEDKINELIKTAILIEQTQHDESIMVKVLQESSELIEEGKYPNAKQILEDGLTYEKWRDKFEAQIRTGIAYCQLVGDKDTEGARKTLEPLTEAQVKDMPEDSYWADLVYKVDTEL